MSATELLQELAAAGVELSAAGGRLRYRAPSGALTSELREQLKIHKAELLKLLSVSADAPVPLAWAQQSFWLLEQLNPGSRAAGEQFLISLSGDLDVPALGRAWLRLQNSHPVLRIRLQSSGDEVLQRPLPPIAELDLPCEPLNSGPNKNLQRVAAAELARGFNLKDDAPIRARLFQFSEQQHGLLITAHHMVADGPTVQVLRRQFAAFYADEVAGAGAPKLGPDYLAYVQRQRAHDHGERHSADRDYWLEQLRGLPESVPLPRRQNARPDGRQERLALELPTALADNLRDLARDLRVTPFMLLLGSFRLLLARLSDSWDIPIGTAVTGRDDETTAAMVGCFVNNVVLRNVLNSELQFKDVVAAERQTTLQAVEHAGLPFQQLVAAMNPARRDAVHPLFQIQFLYETVAEKSVAAEGVDFGLETLAVPRESFWELESALVDHGKESAITGYLGYAPALFEPQFAEALPRRWRCLLQSIVTDPEVRVADLQILLPDEERSLLAQSTGSSISWSGPENLWTLVQKQCQATPRRIALRDGNEHWRYEELAQQVGALTAALAQRGVGRGQRVAIALSPSAELVASVLAVLARGAAYVPLDPAYPQSRLEFMLADSDAMLLLGDAQSTASLSVDLPCLLLDDFDWRGSAAGEPVSINSQAPAYLLYTSGSTGKPKGVVGLHGAAVNRCRWMWQDYGIAAEETFYLRTSLNFVDSLWEIFGALGSGASLVIPSPDAAQDAHCLADDLAREGVTHLVAVPTILSALIDAQAQRAGGLPRLRSVITSGEPLRPDLLRRWRRAFPAARLINTYGTSEVWDVTHCEISNIDINSSHVPIGRPPANVRAYVLDESLNLLPPGVTGELYVGGIGVGGGYWQRPELDAERYLPSPFHEGERLYRSGDLARWRFDGQLECLGRRDHQVKLRGVRIELGEVEFALMQDASVVQAAARISETAGHAARLLAWVVPADGPKVGAAKLRRVLRTRLPPAMVPAQIYVLDRLPLTPSGKIDRLALKEVAVSAGDSPRPMTATQQRVAGILQDLLDHPVKAATDDFFALGGHSLLATRLMAELRKTFDVSLSLRDLFNDPSVAGLAAIIDSSAGHAQDDGLRPVARAAELPLSWGQERLWFLEQLDPGSPAYHIAFTVEVRGCLDRDRLRQALAKLFSRHEALRSRFRVRAGQPFQTIAEHLAVDVDDLPAGGGEQILFDYARRGFSIGDGPLLRLGLRSLGDQRQQLLFVVHHLVADGRSSAILVRDLAALYGECLTGEMAALPALPFQYPEFVDWQGRSLTAAARARELTYWREQLAAAPPALALPTDGPRPVRQKFRGASLRRRLDQNQLAALKGLAKGQGASLFMVLLAAYYLLLRRYSNQTDLLIGTPVAGRQFPELENVIGLFINSLILRVNTDEDLRFSQVLSHVRKVTLAAQANQALPFEHLVKELQPERDLSRAPLFQVMLNLTEIPRLEHAAGPTRWINGPLLDHGVANFDLSLNIGQHVEGAELIFEYDRDLFSAAVIEGFADSYLQLLDAACHDPQRELPVLSDVQVKCLLDRNPVATAVKAFPAVHLQFVQHARRRPDAVALLDDDGESWSYARLDVRSRQLATGLRQHGLKPGDRVALLLDKRADLLTAILGVLRSGGVYLPMDPDYPANRVASLLADAQPALVVGGDLNSAAESWQACEFDALLAASPDAVVDFQPPPGAAAYAVFTSGSTGRPKAVLVGHDNIAAAAASWQQTYELTAGDRHLQVASPAFDVFTADWVRALTTGACLVVCPPLARLDPSALSACLRERRITCAEFVPAVVRTLLGHWCDHPPVFPDLRLVAVGSDNWFAREYRALRDFLGAGARVINSYGVAEATVDSSWFESTEGPQGDGPVPIGQPFAHARLYVCDVNLNLQPVGVPGELCIGGAGVAQGYLGQAALTAERFVADPFSAVSGARLYRTGDRARWRADGELELLGRLDRQVKLRGFRIELGEIEAALSGCQGVSAAVVDLHRRGDGESRLVAWVVGEGWQAESLRAELAQSLPDYMLPSAWVALEELPLTPNGKVDRRGLPAPQIAALRVAGRGPGSALEASVCDVYAAVLGLVSVPATADFFALGGHSLLATQLVARLRDVLQVELPLRVVFEAPTPEGLAAWITAGSGQAMLPAPRAVLRGTRVQWPVSPAQRRLWFLSQLEPDSAAYHLHWATKLTGALDREALQIAVNTLIHGQEILRTVISARDGEPQIELRTELPLSVEFATVESDWTEAAMASRIAEGFVLDCGPLWRVSVLQSSPQEQILLIVIHHIIADGWSLSVLAAELGAAYTAALQGGEANGSGLPLQYIDYAQWQRKQLSGPVLKQQMAYWKQRLSPLPPKLVLPWDRLPDATLNARGAWLSQRLSGCELADMKALCEKEKTTLFMMLLASFNVLLARWSGAEDIVVAAPIAGRSHSELEGLIGFFMNTLPLRTDLAGNPRFRDLLVQVKESALDAFAHAELPFEKLIEGLRPDRAVGRHPLAQVSFVLHNQPQLPISLAGLEAELLAVESPVTKFDLSLHVAEDNDGLQISFNYNAALFDHSTIGDLVAQYALLLEQVSDSPELRIGELRFAAEAAMPAAALPRWSQAVSIGTVFAQVVAADASRLAISTPAYRWSYGALAEYTQRVASAVLAQGGALGDCIGLLGAQDAPVVAGLLGIVTAGRAYVPLDSSVPVARLQALAQTTGLQAVVADSEHQACAAQLGLPVLVIDTQADGRHTPPVEVAVPAATLAYVLSTSGSTGAPKQVGQSHAGVLTQVARYVASLAIQADDRLSWLSSVGFDAAVQDIFGALFSGASLHPVDMRAGVAAAVQVDALVAAQVSVVHATPTVYRHLFGSELSCRHALEMIRAVVLGGEVARRADFELFRSRFAPGTRFINGYGLTECTLVSQWQAEHDTAVAGETLPVGHPVPGLTVQIEDAPGAASWQGEIVLRGAGLAHSDWSAGQGFVAPSSYRTGDWGRWLLSGQLAYVGRRDDQVKLRGLRVSLGELETVLRAYGPVAECAVRLHGEQLVAYVSGLETAQLAGLKAYAQAHLAPWQQPGAWVVLARLPRLANGKLARSELPAPARAEGLPPRGALEEALAEIWQGLLGVDGIHREDDFFALGGHSLLATRLIARIRQQLQIDIPLLAIFEHPVLTDFAQRLGTASGLSDEPPLKRLPRVGGSGTERAAQWLEH